MKHPNINTSTACANFSWLHFSDIHVGMTGQEQLWPRFDTVLQEDLKRTLDKVGDVDLIVFSGDLANKGQSIEFNRFNDIVSNIIFEISKWQARPQLVTVPGNHDLSRPTSIAPTAMALKQFWSNRDLRDGLWDDAGESYRLFIQDTFKDYSEWRRDAIKVGIHLAPGNEGILPGDASYVVSTDAGKLGIVALNSTWLQLSGIDYEGELHVDVRQLQAVTEKQPDIWIRRNDVNLLITHHPASWLHSSNPATWENDINPPGRFDVHLFGHMHEPASSSIMRGGDFARRDMQAASLFGLETFGNEGEKRIHGYQLTESNFLGKEER